MSKMVTIYETNTKKINNYKHYLCACMMYGEIDGSTAKKLLKEYKNNLNG